MRPVIDYRKLNESTTIRIRGTISSSMQMGLNGASHTFQVEMDNIIRSVQFEAILAYQDDLLIFSEDEKAHMEHLKTLFERAKETNLKLKLGKCEFFARRLEFLAHIVSTKGI
jgi:hypothetical protein